jgi:hypothetical protein
VVGHNPRRTYRPEVTTNSNTMLLRPQNWSNDEMLRREPWLRVSVIHEGLVARLRFDGHCKRVELYGHETV